MLKWAGALAAAAGVIGIGVGRLEDTRPETTSVINQVLTRTQTDTQTVYRSITQSVAPTETLTANQTTAQTSIVTQPPQSITQTTDQSLTSQQLVETVIPYCDASGPYNAHLVNGVWTRSTPLKPNLPLGMAAFLLRNKLYSPSRVTYPMQRVDFDPAGNRNPQNRGKSGYVRISWDQALSTITNELQRVKNTYGNSAILTVPASNPWHGALHVSMGLWGPPWTMLNAGWAGQFFSLLGGATTIEGDTSLGGWTTAGPLTYGYQWTWDTNNIDDVLQNSKLVIHWSTDKVRCGGSTGFGTESAGMSLWLRRLKNAGIKQIIIDPYFNDTAAVYGDQWIPIIPETDEALMAAVAYTWITQNLVNSSYINTYTVGFQQFSDYITGNSDGVPKTSQWAAGICGIDADTITTLALEWASMPTYVVTFWGGANRRNNATNWVRMIVTLQALLGYIGVPGTGFGNLFATDSGVGQIPVGWSGNNYTGVNNPVAQTIRGEQIPDAILNGETSWVSVMSDGTIQQRSYPLPGNSQVHLIGWTSGTGRFLNQLPGTPGYVSAVQSPNIEFTFALVPFYEPSAIYSDVILPVKLVGERDDIFSWENYVVYSNALVQPTGEPMNDMDIFIALANQLGIGDMSKGMTADQWLQSIFTGLDVPMSYDQFKQEGYYEYPPAELNPQVLEPFSSFYSDPVKNKLPTPSGKIEIYSQRISNFFENNPQAPPFPQYIPSPEGLLTPGMKYPLLITTPHPKLSTLSQHRSASWTMDEYQDHISGYNVMRINPVDAQARGLQTGDIVKIYNDRGTILCSTYITSRIRPSVIWVQNSTNFTYASSGDPTSVDVAGNPNTLLPTRQPDPLNSGQLNCALVEVEQWGGV